MQSLITQCPICPDFNKKWLYWESRQSQVWICFYLLLYNLWISLNHFLMLTEFSKINDKTTDPGSSENTKQHHYKNQRQRENFEGCLRGKKNPHPTYKETRIRITSDFLAEIMQATWKWREIQSVKRRKIHQPRFFLPSKIILQKSKTKIFSDKNWRNLLPEDLPCKKC